MLARRSPIHPMLLAAMTLSCVHTGTGGGGLPRLDEVLTESGEGTFVLSARLPHPVARLTFARPGDGDRKSNFRVLEPAGARIELDGTSESIVADAPFDRVVLEVPVHQHQAQKDYAPFVALSGGGVLVYTGQLDLGDHESWEIHYRFVARAPHAVVVPGGGAAPQGEWRASPHGTYVAFTAIAPISGPEFVALVDSGFPKQLRDDVSSLLPRLFHHYAGSLGIHPRGRPTIFLPFGVAQAPRSISIQGGVAGGVLILDVRLGAERLAPEDAEVRFAVEVGVAHDSAHLWNGEIARPEGPDWVHEGGADLLAFRALRSLGISPEATYYEQLSTAASMCALLRRSGPLQDDPVQARYACGALIGLVASNGDEPGAESVWKRLLASAGLIGTYDAEAFFRACLDAGAPAKAVQAAAGLAAPGIGDPQEAVRRALAVAGFSASPSNRLPLAFVQQAKEAGAQARVWLEVRPKAD